MKTWCGMCLGLRIRRELDLKEDEATIRVGGCGQVDEQREEKEGCGFPVEVLTKCKDTGYLVHYILDTGQTQHGVGEGTRCRLRLETDLISWRRDGSCWQEENECQTKVWPIEGTGDTDRLPAIMKGLPDGERPARTHVVRCPRPTLSSATLSSAFVRRRLDRLSRSLLHVLACIIIIQLLVY